jgi:hypothetical protein
MGNGGSVGNAVVKVLLTVFVIVLVAIGAVVAAFLYSLHRASTPPDAAAVGRSAAVAQADQRATATLDDRMTTLTALAVDMTPVATSVEDACGSRRGSMFGAGYGPVTCTRTVTRWFGFGGGVAARRQGWDTALRAAGWTTDEPAPQPSAWRWPMIYRDPARVDLTVVWAERPRTPDDLRRSSAFDAAYYRTDQRLDVNATAAAVYRNAPYLAVAELELSYFDASVRPTPSASPNNYHPCFSGSGTCVGG